MIKRTQAAGGGPEFYMSDHLTAAETRITQSLQVSKSLQHFHIGQSRVCTVDTRSGMTGDLTSSGGSTSYGLFA
jgi:hypothetical protein